MTLMNKAGGIVRGRKILVTGAAQGLGLSIATCLGHAGASVVLVDVNLKVLKLSKQSVFGGKAIAIQKDLADDNAAEVISQANDKLGPLDGLVNCAAWSLHGPAAKLPQKDFDRLIAINQRAPFFLSQRFVAQLEKEKKSKDACIVNIASVNAVVGNPNLVAYSGTKGALLAMTRSMAVEFAPRVRVVAISPASILTPASAELVRNGTIQPKSHFSRYLIQRFIAPEEIGALVVFLFSKAATSITGCNWIVDGGYTAQ
jgi:NAD(P)-dependent dehydrogenase (short-subunit alcohol dehydrogenase family)